MTRTLFAALVLTLAGCTTVVVEAPPATTTTMASACDLFRDTYRIVMSASDENKLKALQAVPPELIEGVRDRSTDGDVKREADVLAKSIRAKDMPAMIDGMAAVGKACGMK